MSSDPMLEAFLRRFRPRAPQALPTPHPAPTRLKLGASLAAGLACLALLAAWFARRPSVVENDLLAPGPTGVSHRSIHASLDDPGRLSGLLDAESRRILPDVRDRRGAFRELASLERDR